MRRIQLLALLAILPFAAPPATRDSGAVSAESDGWGESFPARLLPRPTEHRLDRDAERRHKQERREWIEEIHRTAPGVDWRAIERRNGLDRMTRRNETNVGRSGGPSPWAEIGSRNLAGRMHAAALSADGDSLYGGSSLGGVWKADLSGNGWRPLHDNLYGGSHGLAVAAGPPETITSITDGGLIHYTEDGGQTWIAPALTNVSATKRVLSDASDPNRIWLVLTKNAAQRKLYRSDDRGQTYVLKRALAVFPSDIWLDRQVGGRVYLLEGPSFYASDDGGETWNLLGTIPVGAASVVVLTGSEAGAPTFYAAVRDGNWKLYRSVDGGTNWTYRFDIHDFWETLASSITDPNVVMYGGVELWRSVNGGVFFNLVNAWGDYYSDPVNKLHADLPGLDVVWTPGGQEIHYIATDGGLYRSDDRVQSVTNISLEYLRVSQYYSTHTSANDPGLILAGSQDQGYQRSFGPPMGTLRDFDQLISGDYGHITSSDGTHEKIYSDYPGFILVQQGELNPNLTDFVDFPDGAIHSWLPYILAKPGDPDVVYLCGDRIYRFRDIVPGGWNISPSTQDFTVAGGNYLTALSISPLDHDRKIAIMNNGIVWYTDQPGFNDFLLSPDTGPSSHYFYGTALEPSPDDVLLAYAGGSGYSGPGVWRTTDGGVSWTAVSDGLPLTMVYDLAFEETGSGAMYAATEAGPYRLDPATDTWASLDHPGLPLTTYWCVEAVPAVGVMRFGTYGRGIWDFGYGAATAVADLDLPGRGDQVELGGYPNPFMARTTLSFTTTREGPVSLRVYDAAGRLVRELENGHRAAGDHRAAWDGRDADGQRVAAGVYLARLATSDGVATRRITRLR
jgi:photosystem II stability/assembly factor-like uncharacterized protein